MCYSMAVHAEAVQARVIAAVATQATDPAAVADQARVVAEHEPIAEPFADKQVGRCAVLRFMHWQ